MTGLSGMLPPNYTSFASDAVQALDAASGTPAGQRALIATLGARVAHVNAYKVQHAWRAAVLRSLAYATAGGGRSGGMPMGAKPFGAAPAGGRPGGGGALGGLGRAVSALAMLAGRFNPRTSAAAGLSSPAGPWAHRLGR
jgi:hypothetical protein